MKYVIAVSGGVDSMVLLDALTHNRLHELADYQLPTTDCHLVVAHLDHGIRGDSREDELLVREVATRLGLSYESNRVELGLGASEDEARRVRYNFLRQCCKKHKANLITAHHQDDVMETMLINLIRGTNWRGLAPMTTSSQNFFDIQILRPLLEASKEQIIEYAKKYNIQWREDSTNTDTKYLRNYIRGNLLPEMLKNDPGSKQKLIDIYNRTVQLKNQIATELQNLVDEYQVSAIEYIAARHSLVMLPYLVRREIVYKVLTQLDPDWHPAEKQITRAIHFIRTALPEKELIISRSLSISSKGSTILFQNKV